MEEKRRAKRMDLECRLMLKRLDNMDADAAREITVNVVDVSRDGMGFECREQLSIGAVYECFLTIWTKETIHCFVEIIRMLRKDDDIFYGGIFIGMSEPDISRISVYSSFSEVDK